MRTDTCILPASMIAYLELEIKKKIPYVPDYSTTVEEAITVEQYEEFQDNAWNGDWLGNKIILMLFLFEAHDWEVREKGYEYRFAIAGDKA